ncbi:Tumor susceptibility gene 101 protein [Entamoeba marina]
MSSSKLDQVFLSIKPMYMYYQRVQVETQTLLDAFPFVATVLPHPTSRTQYITLLGTIPINYRGNLYNIPMMLMFPFDYPMKAPFFFTDPSPDMMIVPSHPYAMQDRTIVHPTITSWNDSSNAIVILRELQRDFSSIPPLKKKQQSTSSHQQISSNEPYGYFSQSFRPINESLQLQQQYSKPSYPSSPYHSEQHYIQPPQRQPNYNSPYSQQPYSQSSYSPQPKHQQSYSPQQRYSQHQKSQEPYSQQRYSPQPPYSQPSYSEQSYSPQQKKQISSAFQKDLSLINVNSFDKSSPSINSFSKYNIRDIKTHEQTDFGYQKRNISSTDSLVSCGLPLAEIERLLVNGDISVDEYKRMYINHQRNLGSK